ncbi:hypothetical protein C8J57DRAFT_1168452 [Mycena rebaudengoi]|nr:hypothetical protein C8J57DRAFT_1168452 [Mycena rebaudengoi]
MSQYNSPYGGGGGGFLNNSQGSQSSPGGGGAKSAASQSLRPVTIAQIRKAVQMHSEAEWTVDDTPIGQITVVGEIYLHKVFTTNRTFGIDDGTGRMEAKMWIDTADDKRNDTWRGLDVTDSPNARDEHMYVRVTGSIKTHNGKRHIVASNIRVVKDPNEVYFHILEVISVNIVLQKGMPTGAGQEQGTARTDSAYAVQTRPANAASLFSPLADQIVQYLTSLPPNSDGFFVGDIARALNANPTDLSDTVDRLIDEGHVFTTVDDSHIQLAA